MARSVPPFRRARRGGVEVCLSLEEAGMLREVCRQILQLLDTGDRADPTWARLFPRAYLDPTEEEAEAEWQTLVHDDLLARRQRAAEKLDRALSETTRSFTRRRIELVLDEDDAEVWLSVLNDARLALGTRLGVTEDLDFSKLDHRSPEAASYAVYGWLGWAQEHLIQALAEQ